MGNPTDDAKVGARRAASAVRVPLIITIAVIVVLGGGYFAFYRSQVEYYTGRNLRLLSTLTAQIDGRVAMYSRFFRDGILKPESSRSTGNNAVTAKAGEITDPRRGVRETARGWELLLQDGPGETEKTRWHTKPLHDVLRPIFARRVGAAFDMVLIADAGGNILYSVRTPLPGSSLLTNEGEAPPDEEKGLDDRTVAILRSANRAIRERESGSALVVTQLDALSERRGWREYTPLRPARLLAATDHLRVRLGDALARAVADLRPR